MRAYCRAVEQPQDGIHRYPSSRRRDLCRNGCSSVALESINVYVLTTIGTVSDTRLGNLKLVTCDVETRGPCKAEGISHIS